MHIVNKTQPGQFLVLLAFHYLALHPDIVIVPNAKVPELVLMPLGLKVVLDSLVIVADHERAKGAVVLDGFFVLLDDLLSPSLLLFLSLLDHFQVVFLVAHQEFADFVLLLDRPVEFLKSLDHVDNI